MARKKPSPRLVVRRSRNNVKRRLIALTPDVAERQALAARVSYGAYSKHKFNPTAYKLAPYAGQDEERTYCDAHANFGIGDLSRIKPLLELGVMLGLWSDDDNPDAPNLLWTLDKTGWIFELRITNAGQAQYHGYPVLRGDAFAKHVLVRAREVAFSVGQVPLHLAPTAKSAVVAAEAFYR